MMIYCDKNTVKPIIKHISVLKLDENNYKIIVAKGS